MAEKSTKSLVKEDDDTPESDHSDDGATDMVGMPGQPKAKVSDSKSNGEPKSIKGTATPTTKKGK
jgi:hypothetical protein